MNRRMDRYFRICERLGGGLLLLTALASDGGLALKATLVRCGLAVGALLLGAAGRALCSARGRALRQRLFARGTAAPAPAAAACAQKYA